VQILVPFSDATQKVDIIHEWMRVQKLPSEPNEKNPQIVIGYIPPSKKAELLHRLSDAWKGKKVEDVTGADLEVNDEIAREYVRWGVRGHEGFPVPYSGAKESYRGKDRPVCTQDMVELYEANGWLHVLSKAIHAYNSLDAEKKRP
jgi:hypothetical protein